MAKRIGILTSNHFEPSGLRQVYGGAERYGIELTRLLRDMGYAVEWWQVGDNWIKEILPGVPIHGIPETATPYQTMPYLNQAFFEQSLDADAAIYFVMYLAYPIARTNSVSVSHGIYWDHPAIDKYLSNELDRQEWLRRLCLAIGGVKTVVSVDTATIDWVRATWPTLAHKFRYIPNFVDLAQFPQTPPEWSTHRRIRVVFPRRATTVRGINEAGKAALWLTDDLPDIEIHFVGRAHDDAMERTLTAWAATHDRIFYYWLPPHLMTEIYQVADIVWIPTKSSEGTSLSCLEAMAAGCAVITTPVGGLADLVQHEYSGLLIEPTAGALRDATIRLVKDETLRRRLGRHAREVAETFSLERWRNNWAGVINNLL